MGKSLSLGTILRVENDDQDFITVGNLTQLGVPGPEKEEVDVTDFDSVAKEFLMGLPDNGEIPFSGWLNYENAGQALLLADAHNPDAPKRRFQIELTRQDLEFQFEAYVKSFAPNAPGPVEAYEFEGALRIDGAVDYGPIS